METFSALLAICAGNLAVIGKFPAERPVTRNFDVFFDLRLKNDWVNNLEGGDLRRHRAHYDVTVMASQTISRWSGLFDTKPLPEPMLACDLTLWDTLEWNINPNTRIFIQENACEMASIFPALNTLRTQRGGGSLSGHWSGVSKAGLRRITK